MIAKNYSSLSDPASGMASRLPLPGPKYLRMIIPKKIQNATATLTKKRIHTKIATYKGSGTISKKTKLSALAALLALLCMAFMPATAQEIGMTGLPVYKIGSGQPLNEAQILAKQAPTVNVECNSSNSSLNHSTVIVISAYGGNLGADKIYTNYGEQKQMGRLFGSPYASDRPVMDGADREISNHYFDTGRM